jgi:preprotein translocase subunit SecA
VKLWIDEIIEDTVRTFTAEGFSEEWDLEALTNAMAQLYGTDSTVAELVEDGVDVTDRQALIEEFQSDARAVYEEKEKEFGATGENGDGPPLMRELERFVILQVVDVRWREHLENMDYLREGVGLRSMAQKDPLVEYTAEGERMFTELGRAIRGEVVLTLFHVEVERDEAEQQLQPVAAPQALAYEHEQLQGADAIAAAGGGLATLAAPAEATAMGTPKPVVNEHRDIGRNDPCWCGSGKKFKRCHGA